MCGIVALYYNTISKNNKIISPLNQLGSNQVARHTVTGHGTARHEPTSDAVESGSEFGYRDPQGEGIIWTNFTL